MHAQFAVRITVDENQRNRLIRNTWMDVLRKLNNPPQMKSGARICCIVNSWIRGKGRGGREVKHNTLRGFKRYTIPRTVADDNTVISRQEVTNNYATINWSFRGERGTRGGSCNFKTGQVAGG
ncbi:hypothetical protein PUN28_010964 [Cardiocondyla obscurior]|uniref:Uncharacterized protein n=1 Tax=Cardiocondyla obscurior TaxID=286306 RepID=A0AAW2FK30_9HYME